MDSVFNFSLCAFNLLNISPSEAFFPPTKPTSSLETSWNQRICFFAFVSIVPLLLIYLLLLFFESFLRFFDQFFGIASWLEVFQLHPLVRLQSFVGFKEFFNFRSLMRRQIRQLF